MNSWTRFSQRPTLGIALLGLLLGLGPARAQDAGAPFSGPISVQADNAEWRREGVMRYDGSVKLESNGLTLQGQRMELTEIRPGRYRARLVGNPARLQHQATSAEDQPVDAQASNIIYDSGTGELEMDGSVRLNRGADTLSSDRIVYDLLARRIQAAGGAGGQVRITIQPPKSDEAAPQAAQPEPRP